MIKHLLPHSSRNLLADHLAFLYGSQPVPEIMVRMEQILQSHLTVAPAPPSLAGSLSERDVILITYADQLHLRDESPLQTLAQFLNRHLPSIVSGIHLLPFYPYSSDDGFSVIDYRQVNPDFGTWDDIKPIAVKFRLMVDAVINHISSQSAWFQGFLQGISPYSDYFITVDPETDLAAVVRPRDLPLLTPVQTTQGTRHVWTTFSADQIDLNFANPEVMLEILDLLLFYIRQGAQFIRLDAIAFLWKTIGTSCIHLPQAHRVVKLFRTVLDAVAPWVYLITETNVPHEENLSYLGDGNDEAHLIYQFALPPLVLHTLHTGDASRLTAWAADLRLPSDRVTFFNFLGSHDGIGLRPVHDILAEQEIEALVARTKARDGGVSHRRVGKSKRLPYELNITYFDALSEPGEEETDIERWINRFLASQSIMLTLAGVPGIYFHSLFGSRNDIAAVQRTGKLRSINREKLKLKSLENELSQPNSVRARVFTGYTHLLKTRRSQPAFSPAGSQQVLDLGPSVFALLRSAPYSGQRVLCLHEVAGRSVRLTVSLDEAPQVEPRDLLSDNPITLDACHLSPYQVRWIQLD